MGPACFPREIQSTLAPQTGNDYSECCHITSNSYLNFCQIVKAKVSVNSSLTPTAATTMWQQQQ
jgi:hypothetical protein